MLLSIGPEFVVVPVFLVKVELPARRYLCVFPQSRRIDLDMRRSSIRGENKTPPVGCPRDGECH
jgi:hypothetical protein